MALAYPRALLKISGEALGGDKGFGLDYHVVEAFAEEIKAVHALGVHLALVVGGGNIIRGTSASREGLDRVSADYMGMLATVINALALQDILEKAGRDRTQIGARSTAGDPDTRVVDKGPTTVAILNAPEQDSQVASAQVPQ